MIGGPVKSTVAIIWKVCSCWLAWCGTFVGKWTGVQWNNNYECTM